MTHPLTVNRQEICVPQLRAAAYLRSTDLRGHHHTLATNCLPAPWPGHVAHRRDRLVALRLDDLAAGEKHAPQPLHVRRIGYLCNRHPGFEGLIQAPPRTDLKDSDAIGLFVFLPRGVTPECVECAASEEG